MGFYESSDRGEPYFPIALYFYLPKPGYEFLVFSGSALVGQRIGLITPHMQQVTARRQAESLHQFLIGTKPI